MERCIQVNHMRREETRKYVLRKKSSPLKCLVKRRLFLPTVAVDHIWVRCQSASTAVETFDKIVCTYVHRAKSNTFLLLVYQTPVHKEHAAVCIFRVLLRGTGNH